MERKVSFLGEIKEMYGKVGVVIFIFNNKGEILVVREDTEKESTRKVSGELGVVCETSLNGESWQETVLRGLKEELGLEADTIKETFSFDPCSVYLGETPFIEGVLAGVVVVHWSGEEKFNLGSAGDGEVTVIGWQDPKALLDCNLRRGVRNVLERCLEKNLFEDGHGFDRSTFLPLSIENLSRTNF